MRSLKFNHPLMELVKAELGRPEVCRLPMNHVAPRGHCYGNVEIVVRHRGGESVHGWKISGVPGQFIRCVHHAVWRAPDGAMLDITEGDAHQVRCSFLIAPEGNVSLHRPPLIPDRIISLSGRQEVDDYRIAHNAKVDAMRDFIDLELAAGYTYLPETATMVPPSAEAELKVPDYSPLTRSEEEAYRAVFALRSGDDWD